MPEELPPPNKRIKDIVDYYTNGTVSKFVDTLNENSSKDAIISQQRFNRIFNIDTRTNKFPSVPLEVIAAIISKYPELNTSWLLTGKGDMLLPDTSNNGSEAATSLEKPVGNEDKSDTITLNLKGAEAQLLEKCLSTISKALVQQKKVEISSSDPFEGKADVSGKNEQENYQKQASKKGTLDDPGK